MKPTRRLSRRSFLGRVAGGAVAAGALGVVGGRARAQTGPYTGITDTDSGAYADNAGHGRGPNGNAWGNPQQQGVTDSDPVDPPGQGRGGYTGYSDNDSGANADPSGRGRRRGEQQQQQTGITDSDPTDPYGQGRGTAGGDGQRPWRTRPDGTPIEYTGITDSDTGQSRDPAGYGRGSRECRDADYSSANWQHRDPVRRCE